MSEHPTWVSLAKRKPTKKDFPAIGGSWRQNTLTLKWDWSMSSVFDTPGWDDDRTHFLSIPKPPHRHKT